MKALIISLLLMVGCTNAAQSEHASSLDSANPTSADNANLNVEIGTASSALYSLTRDYLFPRVPTLALGTEIKADCPESGSVVISGTQCYVNAMLTYDLVYTLSDCGFGGHVFSGAVSDKGEWALNTMPSVDLESASLVVDGKSCVVDRSAVSCK